MKNLNTISWFEIPVSNFARAEKFYNEILETDLRPMEMGPVKLGFFPAPQGAVTGAIIYGNGAAPSDVGSLVYLNADGKIESILDRIPAAGGKIVQNLTSIGEFGAIAKFLDSEGNLVALHTMGEK